MVNGPLIQVAPSIYIAGKVTARERLKAERERLRALGYRVSSSWIDLAGNYDVFPENLWEAEAQRDIVEIFAADLLLLDTLDVSETGGREFEAGYAYARHIPFWLIGPKRQVFHSLAQRHFARWGEAVEELRDRFAS